MVNLEFDSCFFFFFSTRGFVYSGRFDHGRARAVTRALVWKAVAALR